MLRCLLAISLFIATSAARADNWPSWRGPNRDGISLEKGAPVKWSGTENILWKLPLPGMGGSTPAIWGSQIFLTAQDGKDLVLLCISTAGKEIWRQKIGSGASKVRNDEGNLASGSPSTDGKHVWAIVGNGDLACFTMQGKEVWKVSLQERYGAFRYQFGMHVTPLLVDGKLYIQLIHSKPAWVIALDAKSGAEIWKVERPSDGTAECEHSYASTVWWQIGEQGVLVSHGNDYTVGHDPASGKELWRVGGLNPKDRYNRTLRFVASPLGVGNLLVIPSAKNGPVVGLKPGAIGLVMPGHESEKWRMRNNTPDVPSPLIHNGLVYLCRENGVLICLDAETGAEKYSQRLHSARYRASPLLADGKLYLTARDGTVSVVEAGPVFKLLSVNKLSDQISASPVFADGNLYLRGFDAIYAIAGPR